LGQFVLVFGFVHEVTVLTIRVFFGGLDSVPVDVQLNPEIVLLKLESMQAAWLASESVVVAYGWLAFGAALAHADPPAAPICAPARTALAIRTLNAMYRPTSMIPIARRTNKGRTNANSTSATPSSALANLRFRCFWVKSIVIYSASVGL
jgi:hypothetical protein